MKHDISDEMILDVLRKRSSEMTYVIRNVLSPGRPNLETKQIYRSLIRMERAGVVKRVPSAYQVQICWALTSSAT